MQITDQQIKALDILALQMYNKMVTELQLLRYPELQNIGLELYESGGVDEEKYRTFANYILGKAKAILDQPLT